MKKLAIGLSILGAGLLVTGIVLLVKQKKAEKKYGFDGDMEMDCGCSNVTGKVTGKRKYVKGVLQHPSV